MPPARVDGHFRTCLLPGGNLLLDLVDLGIDLHGFENGQLPCSTGIVDVVTDPHGLLVEAQVNIRVVSSSWLEVDGLLARWSCHLDCHRQLGVFIVWAGIGAVDSQGNDLVDGLNRGMTTALRLSDELRVAALLGDEVFHVQHG